MRKKSEGDKGEWDWGRAEGKEGALGSLVLEKVLPGGQKAKR